MRTSTVPDVFVCCPPCRTVLIIRWGLPLLYVPGVLTGTERHTFHKGVNIIGMWYVASHAGGVCAMCTYGYIYIRHQRGAEDRETWPSDASRSF